MGGDITGKLIIPIVQNEDGNFKFAFSGVEYDIKEESELQNIEQQIRNSGYYPYRTTPEEAAKLSSDEKEIDKLFSKLIVERIKGWVELAEKKLRNKGIKCFINPGNDDIFDIDPILENSENIIMPEGEVIELDNRHEMISTGFANITPWNCPRDINEAKLYDKIEDMASRVRSTSNCIFSFHCPPYNTRIDEAPKLDKDLTPIMGPSGELILEPVGSVAVRKAIEKYQPLLGLHGHVHEGRGRNRIGKTLVLNCGSEYSEGILHGIIVTLNDKKVTYQFTTG